MEVDRMIISILALEPYRNSTGAILLNQAKIIVWDELIIQYTMDWYQVIHALIIEVLLFIVYHICSLNKPVHVCCSIFILCCVYIYLVMISYAIVLQ